MALFFGWKYIAGFYNFNFKCYIFSHTVRYNLEYCYRVFIESMKRNQLVTNRDLEDLFSVAWQPVQQWDETINVQW